jgi:energy-coupling factor transporter transmembrane protein EcfT
MKKSLLLIVFVTLLVLVAGPYAPYWILMILVATVSFLTGAGKTTSFLSPGLAFGLSWMAISFFISVKTDSELPKRMAKLIGLANDNLLLFGTAALGFLIGAFSGLTGAMLRKL